MSTAAFVPPEFEHLVEMASDALGGFALWASDEFFAPKDALVRAGDPVFDPSAYTERGKLMDGWESQRRRVPGHDVALVRLGVAGVARGVLVDTTHFRGNAPTEVSIEAIEASPLATAEALMASDGFFELLPRSRVQANSRNVFSVQCDRRITHVRLRIFPDGGVSRLRVYGDAVPEPSVFFQPAAVDLAAVENGGRVVAVSDRFFGPPSNLLLPGRGVNMGDGWETARRRTPGSDWAVIALSRPAEVERIEVETHFFKGNAPQAFMVECVDARGWSDERMRAQWPSRDGWGLLLGRSPLERHWRHAFVPDRSQVVTHLRCHIYPHGGVNRMRVYGRALDLPSYQARLAALSAMGADEARAVFLSWNGSRALADALLAQRPFASVRALYEAVERAWWSLDAGAHLEAFAAHPKLGQPKKAAAQSEQSASWSRNEQSLLQSAQHEALARMAALNERYAEKYGFIFILCATGASTQHVLDCLEERIENPRERELENAAREQVKITRLRIAKWIAQGA